MSDIEAIRDERGNFCGFTGRECRDHRTVGDYRAWCHECTEWCYPEAPCRGCELPQLRALLAVRDAELVGLRQQLEEAAAALREIAESSPTADPPLDLRWTANECLQRLAAQVVQENTP